MIAVLKIFPVPLLHYLQYQENQRTGNGVANKLLLTIFSASHHLRRSASLTPSSTSSRYQRQYAAHSYRVSKNQLEANLRILSAEYPIGATAFQLDRELLSAADFYFVHLLDSAIRELENYIEKVRHSTSEELIIILSVAKIILNMRRALQPPTSDNPNPINPSPSTGTVTGGNPTSPNPSANGLEMVEVWPEKTPPSFAAFTSFWIGETSELLGHHVIPRNFGLREINIYLAVNQAALSFYKELAGLLRDLTPRVPLDHLDLSGPAAADSDPEDGRRRGLALDTEPLQLALVRVEQFLSLHFSVVLREFLDFLDAVHFLVRVIGLFQEENDRELRKIFAAYPLPSSAEMAAMLRPPPQDTQDDGQADGHGKKNKKRPPRRRKTKLPASLVFSRDCEEVQDLWEYLLLAFHFSSFHSRLQQRVAAIAGLFDNGPDGLFRPPIVFPLRPHQQQLLLQDFGLLRGLFDDLQKIQRFPLNFPLRNPSRPSNPTNPNSSSANPAAANPSSSNPSDQQEQDGPLAIDTAAPLEEGEAAATESIERQETDKAGDVQTHRNPFAPPAHAPSPQLAEEAEEEEEWAENISADYFRGRSFQAGLALLKIFFNLLEGPGPLWMPRAHGEEDDEERRRRLAATSSSEADDDDEQLPAVQPEAAADSSEDETDENGPGTASPSSSSRPRIFPNQCGHPLFTYYFQLPAPPSPAHGQGHDSGPSLGSYSSAVASPRPTTADRSPANPAALSRRVDLAAVSRDCRHFQRAERTAAHFLFREESVFHLLYRLPLFSAAVFPQAGLIAFFSALLQQLVNDALAGDLRYYFAKGRPRLDGFMGNLSLSALYLSFTQGILAEMAAVLAYCSRNGLDFSLAPETAAWFEWIRVLAEVRAVLVREADLTKLRDYLAHHFLLADYFAHHSAYQTALAASPTPKALALPRPDEVEPEAGEEAAEKRRRLASEEIRRPAALSGPAILLRARGLLAGQEREAASRSAAHPLLRLYGLLPLSPEFAPVAEELEAYRLYLLAVDDELAVIEAVQFLYRLYLDHAGLISAALQPPSTLAARRVESAAEAVPLFTKEVLDRPPLNRLRPMVAAFQRLAGATKFHEFVAYLAFLLHHLVYNLFLGSLGIVSAILTELQTILYEGETNPTGNPNNPSSANPSQPGNPSSHPTETIHEIPVRIQCPLVSVFREYFSSIRKLFLFMGRLAWPRFQAEHIAYQRYVPKNLKHLLAQQQTLQQRQQQQQDPAASAFLGLQSPLPSIASFFVSPDDQRSPAFSPAARRPPTTDPLLSLSSPYQAAHLPRHAHAHAQRPLLPAALANPAAPTGPSGWEQLVPLSEFLTKQNYEATLLLVHRICEIKDFVAMPVLPMPSLDRHNSHGPAQTRRPETAADRSLRLLLPKRYEEQLPYELYHRLLALHIGQLGDAAFLVMNPQYSLLLALLLYYLRRELIAAKHAEADRLAAKQHRRTPGPTPAPTPTQNELLLRRIERFNSRFSAYSAGPGVLLSSSFDLTFEDQADQGPGFDSEEEEDRRLAQELFSPPGRKKNREAADSAPPSSTAAVRAAAMLSPTSQLSSPSGKFPAPRGPLSPSLFSSSFDLGDEERKDIEDGEDEDEDEYSQYMRSTSSDELRRECFMVGLSHELVQLVEELPPFVADYYASDLYQLYHHHRRRPSGQGMGMGSLSRQTSFDFDPEEAEHFAHAHPAQAHHSTSPGQGRTDQPWRSPRGSRPVPLEGTAQDGLTGPGSSTNPLAVATEKAAEFRRVIYGYYYETVQRLRMHQPATSTSSTGRKGSAYSLLSQKHSLGPAAAQQSEADHWQTAFAPLPTAEGSTDLNGFYPLHHDLIPSLVTLFKHLYLAAHRLDRQLADGLVPLAVQQFRVEHHQRRHSAYYSAEQKELRRASLRGSLAGPARPAPAPAPSPAPAKPAAVSRANPNNPSNPSNPSSSKRLVPPTIAPAEKKKPLTIVTDDAADQPPPAVESAGEKEKVAGTKAPAMPHEDLLRITEDLQVNNELWLLLQLQRMAEVVAAEQEIVLGQQTDHPHYQRNHYFYYNGLLQRTASFLAVCQKIFPSLAEVFSGHYIPEAERRERERTARYRQDRRERADDMGDPQADSSDKSSADDQDGGISSRRPFSGHSAAPMKATAAKPLPKVQPKAAVPAQLSKKGLFATLSTEFS